MVACTVLPGTVYTPGADVWELPEVLAGSGVPYVDVVPQRA